MTPTEDFDVHIPLFVIINGGILVLYIYIYINKTNIYRVSQEEYGRLLDGVPYVKIYRYNPKHLCP